MKTRQIVGQTPGPHLLITAGVHGDEFEGIAAVHRLISTLEPARLAGQVTLVPVVNEPAFWRGTRTAEDGLDLARTCPGCADGSITQRIAHAVSDLIRQADYYIDLHSGGNGNVLSPLAGYTLRGSDDVVNAQRRMARAFNLPIIWGTGPATEGGRTLSVAMDAGIPAIYTEWRGAGIGDPEGIDACYQGCLNVMAALGMLEQTLPPSRVTTVVEDPRDNAGHLQINYQSPADGFFEPLVELDDAVQVGTPLGILRDVLGSEIQRITSRQVGRVLCLRVFRRVFKGDMLAVILEVPDKGAADR